MMISPYQSALSGLQAYTTRIQANAGNLANSLTEGYRRTRVILSEDASGGVRNHAEKVDSPGPNVYQETSAGYELIEQSNVDLATELPEMSLNATLYKANLRTIQTADTMFGSLLDLKA